ncbi:MAG: LCP family glycopolymer transferase [Acidimicrobiia bacterium]
MVDDRPSPRLPFDVPDQGDDPVVWDPERRQFVPAADAGNAAIDEAADEDDATEAPGQPDGRDSRQFYVDAAAVGQAPPPRRDAERPLTAPAPGPDRSPASAPSPPPDVSHRPPAPLPLPRPSRPSPEAAPAPERHRRRRARGLPGIRRPKLPLKLILLLLPLLPLLLVGGTLLYVKSKLDGVERVPVSDVLDAGGQGTNILIVGSDTRSGIDDPTTPGQRSDAMMVLHLGAGGDKLMSVPRDLVVTIAGSGARDRVNAAYNTDLGGGPGRLIETVRDNLGIPIERYMELDFSAFSGVVDALGGVTIEFAHPAFDDESGLYVTEAGPQQLDGEQALAYVRSRHYTEEIDGRRVVDPTGDLGRIGRQQELLLTVFREIGESGNPFTLLRVGGKLSEGLALDDGLGLFGAMRLVWDLRGLEPETVILPVVPAGDGATLRLDQAQASAVLAGFS